MYKIVIADDEEELRRAIIKRIDWDRIGFEVVGEAENGIEALELVEKTEPDLLLSDIRMPFISGLELARRVRDIRPYTQIAFLSGYDDFSYAQEAIRYNIISYMLKPISIDELTENLIRIREKIDSIFEEFADRRKSEISLSEFMLPLLLDPFQQDMSDEREARLKEEAVACGFVGREGVSNGLKYQVIAISLWDEAGNNRTGYDHVHSINSILGKYIKYGTFFFDDKIVSVLAGTGNSLDKYFHIMADEIIQSVERILKLRCAIGAGRAGERLTELPEIYRDAVGALRYAERSSGSEIRYITDEEPFSGVDMDMIVRTVTGLENKMKTGTREDVSGCLSGIFSAVRAKGISKERLNVLTIELFSGICRALYSLSSEQAGESMSEIDEHMRRIMFSEGDIEKIESTFREFCMKAMDVIEENKKKSSMDICDHAIEYIENNFRDAELSLVKASADIGVSPNYLSSLIKKRTGKSFVDYLTAKRMETAKKMLVESSAKIKDIAEACGYNDQHYFSYCFKKYEGRSPNMLRQQVSAQSA